MTETMIPSLSLTYWFALVVAGTALVFFGGRQIGSSRGVMRVRDLTLTSAIG